MVSSTKEGIEHEADQRHVEIIVRDAGLRGHSEGVTTPGVNDDGGVVDEGENETLHRAIAARARYLAQGRADIQFAAEEVSSLMSRPEAGDLKRARRLGRYLRDNSSVVFKYRFQELWSDADFAGCRRTRRSTSGGVIMFGPH